MLAVTAIAAAFDSPLVAGAALATLPDAIAALLADSSATGRSQSAGAVAARWADARRLVVTGRGLAYAAALETALKIKETARVHAEGPSSADLQLALASSLLRGLNPDAPAGLSKVTATH